MLRGLYIAAILFSLLLIGYSLAMIGEVHSAKLISLFESYSRDSGYNYIYDSIASDKTMNASMISGIFVLFFLAISVLSLIRIKTRTMLVFSIISLVFSVLIVIPLVLMLTSPGSISYDEGGLFVTLYAVIMVAFSIIGTVHAFKTRT